MPLIHFYGEQLVMTPGPEVVLHLPTDGQVLARLPWAKDNRRWLVRALDLYTARCGTGTGDTCHATA